MGRDDVPGQESPVGKSEARHHEVVDLYELLEISPRASQEVIQAAYRALARYYHPDVNASAHAAQRIRQLNAAYTVLGDPQGRARYDLECLRAHRFERLARPERSSVLSGPSPAGRNHALPIRQPVSRPGPVEGRLTLTNGVAIFGLVMVAAMAAILLVVLAMSADPPAGYSSVFDAPTIQFARR